MKTADDFKQQAKLHNIIRWNVHDCSICGYRCGYIIEGDQVYYDSGCDCVTYSDIKQRNFDDIAGLYNMQKNPDIIERFNEFWHFDND